MRICDWSSDVCSSDLIRLGFLKRVVGGGLPKLPGEFVGGDAAGGGGHVKQARQELAGGERQVAAETRKSEARRGGKECGSTGRFGWTRYNKQKNYTSKTI